MDGAVRDVTMRRRHKAQYAARERAHLAPGMPHVRRDRCFTRSSPEPGATHPPLHLKRETVKTDTRVTPKRIGNEDGDFLQLPGF